MSVRAARAFLAGIGVLVLALAQDVVPSWAGFHAWPYAAALAVLLGVVFVGFTEAPLPLLGAAIVGIAGLASGLLGPDTVTVAHAPGTVAPLPGLGAAAFFPDTDASGIVEDRAPVELRRRNGAELALARGGRRLLGSYMIERSEQPAAYVEALDAAGRHLTVTRPTAGAFLSPVLLFPTTVRIGGRDLPADSFAVPAARRRVEAMLFTPQEAKGTRVRVELGDRPGLLLAVDDEHGRLVPGGIGLVTHGEEAAIGGLLVRAEVGTYPVLRISPVPEPFALDLGIGCFLLAGGAWLGRKFRNMKIES